MKPLSRVGRCLHGWRGRHVHPLHALTTVDRQHHPWPARSSSRVNGAADGYIEFLKALGWPVQDDPLRFLLKKALAPGYEAWFGRAARAGVRLLGRVPETPNYRCDFHLRAHGEWGREMYVTPGIVIDGPGCARPISSKINLGHSASSFRQLFYDDWETGETVFVGRPQLGQTRSTAPATP